MQLSSTLRPEKVKKRWKEQRHSYEEDLFKIYDTLLKEQLQKRCVELRLPISDEGLDGEFQLEGFIQNCFDNGVDGQKLAQKVVDQLLSYGWAISESYTEDGCMVIELEV